MATALNNSTILPFAESGPPFNCRLLLSSNHPYLMFELSDTLSLDHLRYNEDLARLSGNALAQKAEAAEGHPMKLPTWWSQLHLSETAVYVIVIAAATVILLLLAYRMGWLEKGAWRKKASAAEIVLDETALDTDIYAHDIEGETRTAVEASDHRTLVQLSYLSALRALCNGGVLTWHPASTPSEYLRALGDAAADLLPFRELTQSYLYTFYGHYPATPEMVDDCTTWADAVARQCGQKGGGQ